jgi:hypothetical protein
MRSATGAADMEHDTAHAPAASHGTRCPDS